MDENSYDDLIKTASGELKISSDIYLKILRTSFEQSDQDVESLKGSIDAGAHSEIQPIAHKLKGVYGNLRVTSLSEPTIEIDRLAKENGPIERIQEQYELFRNAYTAIRNI